MIQLISFVYFEVFFMRIPTVKKFSSRRVSSSTGRVLPPKYTKIQKKTKIVYDLTIDWLKIIRIRLNCTQFCPIPLYLRNKFRTTSELLKRTKIGSKIKSYQSATEYKVLSIAAH